MTLDMVQPKRGRKFDQVIEGAHHVFMTAGYEGASVDDIARAAKVSKATLYSYFPDKRALFAEVARQACEEQTRRSMKFAEFQGPFRDRLFQGCRSFIAFLYSPFGLQMFRAVIAESARFPEFGQQFWETGPGAAHAALIDLFQSAIEDGELAPIDDIPLAAETLTELCKVQIHPRLLMRVVDNVSDADIDRVTHNAVDMFMARYGVR